MSWPHRVVVFARPYPSPASHLLRYTWDGVREAMQRSDDKPVKFNCGQLPHRASFHAPAITPPPPSPSCSPPFRI